MMILGNLQDIAESGAGEFRVMIDGRHMDIFVVHNGHKAYGYINRCPHQGLTLNWMPDQFLTHDYSLIQCGNHDALFRIEDGVCISGPCVGERLSPVNIEVKNNVFVLADNKTIWNPSKK